MKQLEEFVRRYFQHPLSCSLLFHQSFQEHSNSDEDLEKLTENIPFFPILGEYFQAKLNKKLKESKSRVRKRYEILFDATKGLWKITEDKETLFFAYDLTKHAIYDKGKVIPLASEINADTPGQNISTRKTELQSKIEKYPMQDYKSFLKEKKEKEEKETEELEKETEKLQKRKQIETEKKNEETNCNKKQKTTITIPTVKVQSKPKEGSIAIEKELPRVPEIKEIKDPLTASEKLSKETCLKLFEKDKAKVEFDDDSLFKQKEPTLHHFAATLSQMIEFVQFVAPSGLGPQKIPSLRIKSNPPPDNFEISRDNQVLASYNFQTLQTIPSMTILKAIFEDKQQERRDRQHEREMGFKERVKERERYEKEIKEERERYQKDIKKSQKELERLQEEIKQGKERELKLLEVFTNKAREDTKPKNEKGQKRKILKDYQNSGKAGKAELPEKLKETLKKELLEKGCPGNVWYMKSTHRFKWMGRERGKSANYLRLPKPRIGTENDWTNLAATFGHIP
jgi:hypothetical protein